MKGKIDYKKLQTFKMKRYPGRDSPESSLFDDSDYKISSPQKKSEFEKLYNGEPSKYDNVDFRNEYSKTGKNKHSKTPDTPSSVTNNDDYGYAEFEKLYKGASSSLDDIDSYEEYSKADGKVKPDKYEDIWNGGKDYPLSGEKSSTPAITAKAYSVQDNDEKIDRSLAIAEDFANEEKLIIVGGAICIYNGKFYYILTEDEAQRLIFQKYRKEISRASPVTVIRNVAALLKYSIRKVFDEFPVNSHLIVFENGTLEVETGRFRKNSPEDLTSSALGINYNPDCREMPNTKKFLKTIAAGDNDLYELMLQVIGYILSNDIRAKSFFYLEGVGDAGKSRFCDLIASFFPTTGANKVARIALQDLGGKFALGNLVNAKLNISEDLPDRPLSPTTVSRIKMISDSNRLEAEAKYVQAFSFKPQCKLLFASNHPLRLKEYDAAFVNRVVYIPFHNAIPKHKQDPTILEKMQGELPALFNHAFKAYGRLVASGYVWAGADRFKPEICIVNSGISFDKEQILKRFVDTCCIIEEDTVTPTEELRHAYQKFCNENRYMPIMGDRFSRELAAVLPGTVSRVKIGNQRRGFKGIKLQNAHEFNNF